MNIVLRSVILLALSLLEDFGVASDKTCPSLSLSKGIIKYRLKGKLVKFQCYIGYELVGDKYGSCVNGKWDVVSPSCVKPGCPSFPTLEHGIQLYSRRDAVVLFFCLPNFKLVGATNAFCDGKQWNGTKPTCVGEKNTTVSTSCNFEDDGLCGWVHDALHDFDWRRQNKQTPSGHVGTGPSYDHTLGKGKDGHYMYIESSSRLENDTARLLSPLYSAQHARNSCFVFYYHMFGRTTGTLRVYLRPQHIDFGSIVGNDTLRSKYLMFEKKGNQGNRWYSGFFDFNQIDDNFQIIIEGVRGSSYVSDIAIDDVSILQDKKCDMERNNHIEATSSPTVVEDSCSNRCEIQQWAVEFECDCTSECIAKSTCCVDYRDLCVFETDASTSESVTNEFVSETLDLQTLPPPLPTSLMMTQNNVTEDTQVLVELKSNESRTETTTGRVPIEYTSVKITTTFNEVKTSSQPESTTKRTNTLKLTFLTTVLYMNATGLLNKTSTLGKKSAYNDSSSTTSQTMTEASMTTTSLPRALGKQKSAKIIPYSEDAHLGNEDVESRQPSLMLIVAAVVVAVIVLAVLGKYTIARIRPMNSSIFDKLRNLCRFGVLTTSGSSSDIKFLVQDEELEYDCNE